MLPDELKDLIAHCGKERYRANQLMRWVHAHGATQFHEMTDLAKSFRADLLSLARIETLDEKARTVSADGSTTKLLLELSDGHCIETVAMDDDGRRTVCVSSQVGCALGCSFCATGGAGLRRNLTAGEILDQLRQAGNVLRVRPAPGAADRPITNVVFMGMGEPLANFEQVIRAVEIMGLGFGMAISQSKVTVSTAGLVPMIRRLADTMPKVGLAISLNATTDEVRRRLMPIARKYTIAETMEAAAYMTQLIRRRRVTLEYALIEGVNDTDEDARRLAALAVRQPCKVNLIPFNAVPGVAFRRPSADRIRTFYEILWNQHLTVTVRWSKGDGIAAGCGQLSACVDGETG